MRFSTLLPNFALLALAAAQHKGFNYGSTLTDGSAKSQAVFEAEFAAAKALPGTSGFNSARLYTCIQAGTTNTPIAAIPAAIAQDTTLLLGLWASAGEANIQNEIAALKAAITQYGTDFTSRVVGISVGSEDLYRTSTIGIAAMAGVGTTPDVLVNYIGQVRTALAGTALSGAKITHVDTYNAYTNGSNAAVIDAIDFISVDAYPFFQKEMDNRIDNGLSLFQAAYNEVVAVARSKDIWVTETGWPVSGDNQGAAQASAANAKTFWDAVGCGLLFGKVNTYWYVLQDALPTTPSPSFGLIPTGPVNAQPLYNLTCPAILATPPVVVSSSAATSSRASGRPTPPRASSSSQSVAVSGNPVILPAPTSRASSARTSATATTSRAAGGATTSSSRAAEGATTSSSRAAGGATTSAAASASAPTSTTGDAGSLHGSLLVAGLFGTLAIFMTL